MSGIFEELEMFDEGDKVVTRQAIAAATKRFNDNFGGFLRQASTEKEFNNRLALVDADINNMVADVVTEYGGSADKITSAVKETVKTAFAPTTPSANEYPMCENCGGHGCDKCTNDPEASKTASEKRPEHLKAQDEIQLAEEHSQVNPWLKKQIQDEDQEDGGNLRNKEAAGFGDMIQEQERTQNSQNPDLAGQPGINSQPIANPVPLEEKEGYGGNIEEKLEKAPSAVGTGVTSAKEKKEEVEPETKHEKSETAHEEHEEHETAEEEKKEHAKGGHEYGEKKEHKKPSGAHTVKKKDDKFYVIEDGNEKAAGPFDSQEEAYARANELNDLENLETEETHKEAKGKCKCWNGYERVPGTKPCAPGSCRKCDDHRKKESAVTPTMAKALALKEAAARGEKRNFFSKDEWVNEGDTVTEDGEEKKVEDIAQHGDEKVVELSDGSVADIDDVEVAESKTAAKPETGDKTEENESLPTGNEDAHDGPSPKIDKTKWKPNATNPDGNLKPIDTEGENSPHPTRQMDIKQKPDYQEDTFETVEKYDNNVWKREDLPTATEDEAGFEGTRNIEQFPTKTFPDKGQTNPVTDVSLPQALAEKTALFEDERDILEKNVPEDYAPSREGIMSELADLKQRLIEGGSSPEEAEAEIKDLVMGMWRTEQSPEELDEIGIEDVRSENDEIPAEDVELDTELTPEGASVPVDREIEDIIERGDDDDDRVEVIHDELDEEEERDPLGFDDPDELDEDEDEDIPFDEELSEEELDRLLKEEEYDDEDLFL